MVVTSSGFSLKKSSYKIVFADPNDDLLGLEVTVREFTIGELRLLMRIHGGISSEQPGMKTENALKVFDFFGRSLISWNIVDENDVPVPANTEGLDYLGLASVIKIINTWMEEVAQISTPLEHRSGSGMPVEISQEILKTHLTS